MRIRPQISLFVLSRFPKLAYLFFVTLRGLPRARPFRLPITSGRLIIRQQDSLKSAFNLNSKILIVVPEERYLDKSWGPGGGNFYFEILQSAREQLKINEINFFVFPKSSYKSDGFADLLEVVVSQNYTHCLAPIETDPDDINSWNWDDFGKELYKYWKGKFIGLSTDSVYLLHQLRFAAFNKQYPNSILLGIDVCPTFGYLSSEIFVGPVFLPISSKSFEVLSILEEQTFSAREFDVVFVGKIYPYREPVLEYLSGLGLNIGINPHLQQNNLDEVPKFQDYIRALRMGRLALNLSRAGGVDLNQLKSRALEAPLFGTPVLSDDISLISAYFRLNEEFLGFNYHSDTIKSILKVLDDEVAYQNLTTKAQLRAESISSSVFWNLIQKRCAE